MVRGPFVGTPSPDLSPLYEDRNSMFVLPSWLHLLVPFLETDLDGTVRTISRGFAVDAIQVQPGLGSHK